MMDLSQLGKLVQFIEPIVEFVAPPIVNAIKAEIAAHSGMTADQRSDMLSKLEGKIDADQKLVDSLTANAQPDPV